MASQVFAIAGVTIEPGCGFIFTGNQGTGALAGCDEVMLPTVAGGILHGFAGPSPITDSAATADHIELARIATLQLVGACAAGDVLTIRTDGKTEKRVATSTACGQALQASAGGAVQAAVFLGPDRQGVRKVGVASDPTEASTTWQVMPDLYGSLMLRGGGGIALIFGASLDIQTGDDFEVTVFVVDSMGAETEVPGLRRRFAGAARKTSVAIATQLPAEAITGPTAHLVQVRWRAITGMARSIGQDRSLWIGQY